MCLKKIIAEMDACQMFAPEFPAVLRLIYDLYITLHLFKSARLLKATEPDKASPDEPSGS